MRTQLLLATLFASATAASAAEPLTGSLRCSVELESRTVSWNIELDDRTPLATVDGLQVSAKYTASHAHLSLDQDGRSVVIGRRTGRLLLAGPDGHTLAHGQCSPGMQI